MNTIYQEAGFEKAGVCPDCQRARLRAGPLVLCYHTCLKGRASEEQAAAVAFEEAYRKDPDAAIREVRARFREEATDET